MITDFLKIAKPVELLDTPTTVRIWPIVKIEHYGSKASDSPDHRRIFDEANDPHDALALRTDQEIIFVYFVSATPLTFGSPSHSPE